MELRHLRCFQSVARQLSFSRAARELRVSQPALSRQLKALEEELHVQLLDRNRQRVYLTDDGRAMLRHADKVLAEVDITVAAARGLVEGRGGELVIGHDWRLAFSFIPDTLAEFRRSVPQSEVSLREMPFSEQAAALQARRIHLGFIPRRLITEHGALDRLPVLNSEFVLVVPAGHRLARRRRVTLAECAQETWVQVDDPVGAYRNYLTQQCRIAGFAPIFGKRADSSIDGVLSMTAAGYGLVLLPRFLPLRTGRSLRILKTDCDAIEICAVWLRGNRSRLLAQYLEILRRFVASGLPTDRAAAHAA